MKDENINVIFWIYTGLGLVCAIGAGVEFYKFDMPVAVKSHYKPAPQPQAAKVPEKGAGPHFDLTGVPGYQVCAWFRDGGNGTIYVWGAELNLLPRQDYKVPPKDGWVHVCVTTPAVEDRTKELAAKDREIAQLKAELARQRKLTGDAQGLVLRALRDMNSEDQLVTSCKNTMNTCLETLKESQGMIAPLPSEYQVNVWP